MNKQISFKENCKMPFVLLPIELLYYLRRLLYEVAVEENNLWECNSNMFMYFIVLPTQEMNKACKIAKQEPTWCTSSTYCELWSHARSVLAFSDQRAPEEMVRARVRRGSWLIIMAPVSFAVRDFALQYTFIFLSWPQKPKDPADWILPS